MARRRVLITGSAGHLGRALRAAFEANGDEVVGIDLKDAELICDLDKETDLPYIGYCDVVVCNAKLMHWHNHHVLASCAQSCVVNVSSIYGRLGSDPRLYKETKIEPTPAWYVATKGAIIALTRWQATTWSPVRVNCVCPGGIERDHSPKFKERYNAKVPLGRMATEDDIVGPIMFLCSDAARYITGQVLMVDGGYSAW